jgi:RNA polymerase sigma factor (sigma-70 family)
MTGLSPSAAAASTSRAAASDRTDALYRQHSTTVARICRALLRDDAEAEDATQQVFLSAHRALLHGAAPREPAAWLATIARHECWARIRARMSTPLATPDGSLDRLAFDAPGEAIQRVELDALWQALADLPRAQRDAVLLREIRGLSYDQVAEQLALSHSSVRSLLGRARHGLRTRLRDVYSGVAGVPWFETLVRSFSGGGTPVAAKAVALGLGAAAISGGAVMTPDMLEHQVRHVSTPRLVAHQSHSARAARRVASPPVVVAKTRLDDRRTGSGRSQRERLGGGRHSGSDDNARQAGRRGRPGDSSGSGDRERGRSGADASGSGGLAGADADASGDHRSGGGDSGESDGSGEH